MMKELNPWREKYENKSQEIIAETSITLDRSNCTYAECVIGNVVADSYLSSYRRISSDTRSSIALVQSGAIRVTLPKRREYLRK